VNSIFSLHALAPAEMLHKRESCCRKAVRKPVIHANRKRNDTLKDQIADLGFVRPSHGSISGKLKVSNR
jgi:hypothetical protein